MKATEFQKNRTYMIHQASSLPLTGGTPRKGEIYVVEVLMPVSVASAEIYKDGKYVKATDEQIKSYDQFLRVTRRSSRKVFFIDPTTIETAVMLST